MELSTLPPRIELAVQPNGRDARVPPQAASTRPETLRPVAATEAPRLPAPIKGLGIAPLDLFQVGDNDETPPPPDPPRKPATLSVQPAPPPAPPVRESQAPDVLAPDVPGTGALGNGTLGNGASANAATLEPVMPPPSGPNPPTSAPAPASALPELLALLDRGEDVPTFDLRR